MFLFTDDYRLGVPTLDNEHEQLVNLLNDALVQLQKEDVNLQELAVYVKEHLQEYANTHFVHEEAYMEQLQYPELSQQKQAHASFISKINELPVDDTLTVKKMEAMMQYWVLWLFRHILHSDMMIGKIEKKEEDIFAFTDKFKTGISIIDEQHKTLFDIIRQANELVQERMLTDKYDEIMDILDELHSYTEDHFRDEEAYMKKIKYPKLPQQVSAHNAFIDKLVKLDLGDIDYIDEHQQEYLEDLIVYLLDWLTHHILIMDHQIAEWAKLNQIQE